MTKHSNIKLIKTRDGNYVLLDLSSFNKIIDNNIEILDRSSTGTLTFSVGGDTISTETSLMAYLYISTKPIINNKSRHITRKNCNTISFAGGRCYDFRMSNFNNVRQNDNIEFKSSKVYTDPSNSDSNRVFDINSSHRNYINPPIITPKLAITRDGNQILLDQISFDKIIDNNIEIIDRLSHGKLTFSVGGSEISRETTLMKYLYDSTKPDTTNKRRPITRRNNKMIKFNGEYCYDFRMSNFNNVTRNDNTEFESNRVHNGPSNIDSNQIFGTNVSLNSVVDDFVSIINNVSNYKNISKATILQKISEGVSNSEEIIKMRKVLEDSSLSKSDLLDLVNNTI